MKRLGDPGVNGAARIKCLRGVEKRRKPGHAGFSFQNKAIPTSVKGTVNGDLIDLLETKGRVFRDG